jgi:hypothetical protein
MLYRCLTEFVGVHVADCLTCNIIIGVHVADCLTCNIIIGVHVADCLTCNIIIGMHVEAYDQKHVKFYYKLKII